MKDEFAISLMGVTGILVASAFAIFASALQGAAVLAGLGLGVMNYHWLYRGAMRFFEAVQEGAVGRPAWMWMAVFRIGFLAAAMALLLKMGLPPVGLVVGLSVPVFSQVVWSSSRAFQSSARSRSEEVG